MCVLIRYKIPLWYRRHVGSTYDAPSLPDTRDEMREIRTAQAVETQLRRQSLAFRTDRRRATNLIRFRSLGKLHGPNFTVPQAQSLGYTMSTIHD